MDLRHFLVGVVDDDPRILESFEELLDSAGYKVLVFSSAEAFLGANGIKQVDCVISDIRMPSMSGWELLRVAQTQRPDLPVILMTGRDEEHSRGLIGQKETRFLFRKPVDGRDILAALNTIFSSPQDE